MQVDRRMMHKQWMEGGKKRWLVVGKGDPWAFSTQGPRMWN